jgi:hypothetical protein
VEDFKEEGYEETDEESEFREENERQIALMVVDALGQSQWIGGRFRITSIGAKDSTPSANRSACCRPKPSALTFLPSSGN